MSVSGGNTNGTGGGWDIMKILNCICTVIGSVAAVVSAVSDHCMLEETKSFNEYTKKINYKPKTGGQVGGVNARAAGGSLNLASAGPSSGSSSQSHQ